MSVDLKQMKDLQEGLKTFEREIQFMLVEGANALAGRFVRNVRRRTPTDTGTLKRSWKVHPPLRSPSTVRVVVENNMEYASYVEYGHRTRNHKGWVPGKHMAGITEDEIEASANMILDKVIKKRLGRLGK